MRKIQLLLVGLVVGFSVMAIAAPVEVPYVGYLNNDDGTPYDGTASVVAELFAAADGGNAVTTCTFAELDVQAGVMSFVMGGDCTPPLTAEMFAEDGMWLAVTINDNLLEPRQKVLSVAYALQADNAQKLGGEWASEYVTSTELGDAGYVEGKDLADVATSGSYDDLSDAPDLAGYALTDDLQPVCFSGSIDDLIDLDLSAFVTLNQLATVATTGAYGDLTGAPDLTAFLVSDDLAVVALSGLYSDLVGVPDLAPYAMTTDLATVALSGDFNDLTGVPDLTPYAKNVDLATVALSGDYTDLAGKPDLSDMANAQDLAAHVGSPHLSGDQIIELTGGEKTELHTHAGILGDGKLPAERLPEDGLDEVSGGALSSTFPYEHSAADLPKTITTSVIKPTTVKIEIQEDGIIQGISTTMDVTHGDTSELKISLTSPEGTEIVLHDHNNPGAVDLQGKWPDDFDTVGGSLDDFIGENPVGNWTVTIWDDKLTGVVDGSLNSVGVDIAVLQADRIAVDGDLDMGGHRISNLGEPVENGDAASKAWVKERLTSHLEVSEVYSVSANASDGAKSLNLGSHFFCFLTFFNSSYQSGMYQGFGCNVAGIPGGSWILEAQFHPLVGGSNCKCQCLDFAEEP